MVHFKVVQDKATKVWHVYDNWKGEIARTYRTRHEARWSVKAYNGGYAHEVEEKTKTNRTPADDTRQG
jgi:hypothetical protein